MREICKVKSYHTSGRKPRGGCRTRVKTLSTVFLTAICVWADQTITVLAGGEAHGMVRACDCPDGFSGGFAARAEVAREMAENGPILQLDAGGFSGGGPYDLYTLGRESDSLRTFAAIRAMAQMGYDAVAVGDDDLRYGLDRLAAQARKSGLPLVSANLKTGGDTAVPSYLLVNRAGLRIGITALTSPERIVTYDSNIDVGDPRRALGAILPVLDSLSDMQVLLSHLGETLTDSIAREFPTIDLIVNGHRKSNTSPGYTIEAGPTVLQFGFQGKQISAARIRHASPGVVLDSLRWIEVDTHGMVENAASRIIEETTSSLRAKEVLDLYIMSNCPYGLPAVADVLKTVEKTSDAEFDIYFIGDVEASGKLESLHGEAEVEDEKVWLSVKHQTPRLWPDFLYLRTVEQLDTRQAVSALGLDSARIVEWAASPEAHELLAGHYRRSNRLNVDASPTLFRNNRPVSFPVSAPYLRRALCEGVVDGPICDSLPECLSDNECTKPGKLGRCIHTDSSVGCVYTDAVSFDFVMVIPESSVVHPEVSMIQTTRDLFPGARIRTHTASSKKGRALLKTHTPELLPLILFSPKVRTAANYGEIENGLRESAGFLTFRKGIIPAHFLHKRKTLSGRRALLLDPLFPDSYKVMHTFYSTGQEDERDLQVIPVLPDYSDTARTTRALASALLWLALEEYDAEIFREFVKTMSNGSDSTDAEEALLDLGVDREVLRKHVEKAGDTLEAYRKDFNDLWIGEPVAVLFNNQEIVPVGGEQDLIEQLSAKPTPAGP